MGKGANAAMLAHIALPFNKPILLYDIGDGTYRFAKEQTADIIFNGFTWRGAAIGHSPVSNARDASIDETNIKLAVIANEFAAYIAAGNSPNGLNVIIDQVDADALGDPLNYIREFAGQIDGWQYLEEEGCSWLSIRGRRNHGTFGKIIPRRRYKAMCPWIFKGTECGYAGGETLCDRTPARCDALGMTDNFGGFRWVPHPSQSDGIYDPHHG